ncbi:MAG: methylenetetrahydrofolate--tRNA-(uracil(54)-C(5))-methyltransferase (FADH(2)-oxidizing) TrmFO [Anaerosomatales bacterium]|nr:methylenetetrahydrofolate--tRNA-(uracil(54)-C(5))-methyltransferase (FADH(2)-oxidizing) TrmFO [Anaerosomatales bacterium]
MSESVTVIGGGLAGTEAAWQLGRHGVRVRLIEMRPATSSPAHSTGGLAELVCSNSFKGTDPSSATGTLKQELERLGSVVLAIARRTAVPAGAALAVDRAAFTATLTDMLESHPLIEVLREEATLVPAGRSILATGPLTSPAMETALSELVGSDRLAFYDAAAPIVDAATIDRSVVFAASRYGKGGGADYLNCPLDRERYEAFITELRAARRVLSHEFERTDLFQACQPIEEVARSGPDAARFGALKPVGLTDPNTGERPWAVVQLRPENAAGTAYNLVGFQTNLAFGEQRRVFGMIPGLTAAEFLRYGVMHRNTFIDAPSLLDSTLALRSAPHLRVAGQLTGTEGYLEAAGSGLLAALNTVADLTGTPPVVLPPTTALGALIAYATNPATVGYQPMHVNWGLVPPLDPPVRGKRSRYAAYAARAADDISVWASEHPLCGHRQGSVER